MKFRVKSKVISRYYNEYPYFLSAGGPGSIWEHSLEILPKTIKEEIEFIESKFK